MDIGRLCQRRLITIGPGEDVTVAARLMREHHVGYLVVVEPGPTEGTLIPVGVLTDRDIVVAVVARETDARMVRVDDVMSANPILSLESDSVAEALQKMRRIGVRRLPVVDDHGSLIGVLSLDDVIDVLASQLQGVAGSIRGEQLIERVTRPCDDVTAVYSTDIQEAR